MIAAGAVAAVVLSSFSQARGAVPAAQSAVKLVLTQQADVSGAFALPSKQQRGQFVLNALVSTANRTQPAILQALSQMGLVAEPYYVANFILVQAPNGGMISSSQLQQLASRPDIALIEPVQTFNTKIPAASAPALSKLPQGRGIEKNIESINAPAAWAKGGQGQGTTIGIIDSGVQWDHPLLRSHYRGTQLNGTVDHNYNWWDAVHTTFASGANPCGVSARAPCEDLGHGTEVAGIAAGGNGRDYQIGVAPKATFIGCRDMDRGYGTSGSTFEECLQFMLAPWDLSANNPDPSRAPDVVVNPYHCYAAGAACTDDPVLNAAFWNLYAAGITTVVAAEDSGQVCGSSVASLPQPYGMAIVTGALDFDAGTGEPASTVAAYSAAGPGDPVSMMYKPSIAAPGTRILSAAPGGNVTSISGTSMAAAHVAGTVGLLISVQPKLQGRPELVWRLIAATTPKPVPVGTCGSAAATPNNIYGWGTLDLSPMLAKSGS